MGKLSVTEQAFKEILTDLVRGQTALKNPEFNGAYIFSPEEIKRRMTILVLESRQIMDELIKEQQARKKTDTDPEEVKRHADDLKEHDWMIENALSPMVRELLNQLGGDTREQVINIYKNFEFDSYWFHEGFGRADDKYIHSQLQEISESCDVPMGELKVLDVGTGNGRIMSMIIDMVEKNDPSNIELFTRQNIKGFDLVPEVVENARERLAKKGLPREAVFEGDYLNLPERLEGQKFHLITVMMHTTWHCTTEDDWLKFLKNMESLLLPGGRLVFDTVNVMDPEHNHHTRDLSQDIEEVLGSEEKMEELVSDLLSFYTLLWRRYCDKNQPIIEEIFSKYGVPKERIGLLIESPRCFIQDRTAGVEGQSFVREIPKVKFISDLCRAQEIALVPGSDAMEFNSIKNKQQLITMGCHWLLDSNLKDWLRGEVASRLFSPSDVVEMESDKKLAKKENNEVNNKTREMEGAITKVYEFIAHRITGDYINHYLSYEKVAA